MKKSRAGIMIAVAVVIAIAAAIFAYRAVTERYYFIFFSMSETVINLTIKTAAGRYTIARAAPGNLIGAELIFSRAEWSNDIIITGENENGDAVGAKLIISDLTLADIRDRTKEASILNQTTGAVSGTAVVEIVSAVNPHHAMQRE